MNESKKFSFLITVLIVSFLVASARLFDLQIIHGKENRLLADENRIQKKTIVAPRGIISDRHGEDLVRNEPVFTLGDKVLSLDEELELSAKGEDLNLKINLQRAYLSGEVFGPILGYLGEVSSEELNKNKLELKGYSQGSLIGRTGIESEYEGILKGHDGSELLEVDTLGKPIRKMAKVLPSPGKSLTLSVDKSLQEAVAKAMAGKKGAVIATNPFNGEVLALYSSPSFDNNLFLKKDSGQEIAKIVNDKENRPLLNRVISGLYQPGSTFKIVTSTAGLEEKKITPETLINDPGVIIVGDYQYANWYWTFYGRTEGEINLKRAITRSTDTFFYKLGEMVGVEKLNFWADKFNLNKTFGIDLPGEVSGFVATPEWKQKNKGEPWFLGNTYHLAIGQGDIALTPLSVNMMTAVVANGGKICTPRMLKIGAENTPYSAECKDIGIKKKTLDTIMEGMVGACSSGGTAYPFFDFKPTVACKTGTAETGDGKETHAWFTAFAPYDPPTGGPEIVLTVLVEKGGEGSSVAAPIAKEILKEYFKE